MPHDPVRLADARAWLAKAHMDLRAAAHELTAPGTTRRSALIRAAELTQYAWKFRYPGEPGEPSLEEANVSIDLAREVYVAVVARLPPESALT